MPYYYDTNGWHTSEMLPDRATDIAPPTKVPQGMRPNFTGHKWVLEKFVEPAPTAAPVDPAERLAQIKSELVTVTAEALLSGDQSQVRVLLDEYAALESAKRED